MPNKVNFTIAAIEATPPPLTGRTTLHDEKAAGLTIVITPKDVRSFYLYRRGADGRPLRFHLGTYPRMTIDQARRAVAVANGQIAAGVDPRKAKRSARSGDTLGSAWSHFLESYAKVRKRSWREDERTYDLHLAHWKARRLSDITQGDVTALHNRIGKLSGQYAANRVLALLSTIYSKSIQIGYAGNTPTRGVVRFDEEKRERFMAADELPKFFKALQDTPSETMRDAFTSLILTGARRGNVRAMRWDEVNLSRALWTVSRDKAKGKKPLNIHLPASLVVLLQDRKDKADAAGIESPYVFPGTGKTGHVMELKASWKSLLKRAGLDDLRIHDLRRTLGSWQAATGASLPIIGKTLGHTDAATTQVYARLDLDPVRASVDTATNAMLLAGGLVKADPVQNSAQGKVSPQRSPKGNAKPKK